MEVFKSTSISPPAENTNVPWKVIDTRRPLSAPQPRAEDNRRRTRSQPYQPFDEIDADDILTSHMTGQEKVPRTATDRPVRRTTRNNSYKQVASIPKPEPHPTQNWADNLKFPFKKRGPCESLECTNLRLLDADQFLNDEVLNFHLAIIRERLLKDNPEFATKVHFFNTYLYDAFANQNDQGKFNYDKVKRWTKDVDIFAKELVFIPVNEKFHWFLAVVCNLPSALASAKARAENKDDLLCVEPKEDPKPTPRKGTRGPVPSSKCAVIILDSMNGPHMNTLKGVKSYLKSECSAKKGIELDLEDIAGLSPRKIPGQDNFSDCGIFMLHYIEKWLENPSPIKDALYERDFGSEEAARRLWKISEVLDKRDRMWRLYVRMKEEHEKFLNDEPYTQFPEIEEPPAASDQKPEEGEEDELMVVEAVAKSSPKAKGEVLEEVIERVASPAKRKSGGRDEHNPPAKRAKSVSPEVSHPPKKQKSDTPDMIISSLPIVPPGLGCSSPEIPHSGDLVTPDEIEEPNDDSFMKDAEELVCPDVPLVAANGLVVTTPSVFEGFPDDDVLVVINSVSSPRNIPNGISTPTLVTTASFNDLSIDGEMAQLAEQEREQDDIIDDEGDTAMTGIRPRDPVEDIEESQGSNPDIPQMLYSGAGLKGKSTHELANDRIVDELPSSQDPNEPKTLSRRKGDAVHDPIVLDSQSSPKKSGLRPSSAASKS
ncbi:hypothetical protein ABW20_dc0105970 [Dactylellina cionopaga]|nr:hypothetical protein ABW20_dc0105970 [Dactylellina cionopaga]